MLELRVENISRVINSVMNIMIYYYDKRVSFINSTFEDLDLDEKFDLIYAASSFQCINGCDRLGKVYGLLQNGGVFARLFAGRCS